VRLALSHALNREEIGAILQNGLLRPVAFSLDPANPSYSEEGARLHSQYDPGKSRRLLDEAGYRDSDGDGFREFQDGSVFTLTIDVFNNTGMVDLCEFIADYWDAIGLKTVLNIGLQEMLIPRRINGTFEVHITSAPVDPLSQAQNSIDRETIRESVVEIRDICTRELPFIMIGAAPSVWAGSTRLGNVADNIHATYTYRGFDRAVFHEQLFIRPDSTGPGD
jgi:ABC-type transport system substrate-binding protein